ncbi:MULTISPECIES: RES family NAD+ phosphorylase [Rothia]|uniref:RES family NAD+ phosphorylase n=1 Tax=Rothia TaxID=32207 RepID=UPI0009F299A0|nr:RES family NAD+ phosphorylase [Rothia sp. HMSC069C04]
MKEAFMPFEPRHLSTLKPPPADLKASDIPVVYAGPGTEIETVFRVHNQTQEDESTSSNVLRDSRHYSSSFLKEDGKAGGGRFDLPKPFGTCNTATDPFTAMHESFGQKSAGITVEEFVNKAVTELLIMKILRLADYTKPSPYIVPGDISGPLVGGYGVTQEWAKKMKDLGFDGIYSRSCHGDGFCVYIFGDGGVHTDLLKVVDYRSARDVYREMQRAEHLPPVIPYEDMGDDLL